MRQRRLPIIYPLIKLTRYNFFYIPRLNIFLGVIMLKNFFIITALFFSQAHALEGVFRMYQVSDGDTFSVQLDNGLFAEIRINGIDAPELAQPFGEESKNYLNQKLVDKKMFIVAPEKDKYGRYLGNVYVNYESVAEKMLAAGMAYHYKDFNQDKTLAALEQQAKNQKIGLWSLPEKEQVAPWDWRHSKNPEAKEQDSPFDCKRKYCKSMSSCQEAVYKLTVCGYKGLDRDQDGIPCEAICK